MTHETYLVVPLVVDNVAGIPTVLARANEAQAQGATAIEYRVDTIAHEFLAVAQLVAQSPLPAIITARHACETGGFSGAEEVRIKLYEKLCAASTPPLAVDVELSKWQAEKKWAKVLAPFVANPEDKNDKRTKLILSSHDFSGRPDDLANRLAHMLAEPFCSVPKLAWKAQGLEDCALAMRLLVSSPRPCVALAMGEAGIPSRILAKKGGAFMTFAALDQTSGTASGQPLLADMKNLYHWDDMKASTKVYGIIGCPVGHSMSPAIHNAGFKEIGFDGVYVPMRVEEGYENLERALTSWSFCKGMNFSGASVTIPHKENLVEFAKRRNVTIQPLAEEIGAANTFKLEDGAGSIENSDYMGLLLAATRAMAQNLMGKRVAIVGAGGAARAAVAGFTSYGAQVMIFNRSSERSEALAKAFKATSLPLSALLKTDFDLLINATPLGMTPNVDSSPLGDGHVSLSPKAFVFDTVYNPIETKLIKQARSAGCKVILGTEMFVLQAAVQFKMWTGQEAPEVLFRKVVLEKLT